MEWDDKLENQPLFELGDVFLNDNAKVALEEAEIDFRSLIIRHGKGDWGDVDDFEVRRNEKNLNEGDNVCSRYRLPTGVAVCIKTEANTLSTRIFLPMIQSWTTLVDNRHNLGPLKTPKTFMETVFSFLSNGKK